MPRKTTPLTDIQVKNTKNNGTKELKLFDGDGLYLRIDTKSNQKEEEARKELCSRFEPRWAAKVLIEKKLLLAGSDKKPQSTHRLPGLGLKRCYHFPASDDKK